MPLRTVLINRPNAGLFGLMFNQVCINVSNDAGPYRFTAPNTPLLIMYRISYYVLQTLTHTNHCITFVQKFPCVENFYVSNTCAFLSATHVVKVCAPVTQLH